jgi:hypothetical protein
MLQLIEGLGLPYEVVGSAASLRLRVLPPAWAGSGGTGGGSSSPEAAAAAAVGVEGAKKKEYW